jgi:copper(I)-binding protein
MLLDLKAPLAAGTTLPLTLQLRDAKGATTALDVQVTVRALNGGAMGQGMGHGPAHGR